MKKILILSLLLVITVLVVENLYDSDLNLKTMPIEERDSAVYVTKSVEADVVEVVYGETVGAEDGSANLVASIVVNYRSFDTLGEVSVLFIASLGVAFLMNGVSVPMPFKSKPNFMLKVGGRMIFGFLMLLGIFMMSHGHLTPGGGFPGGSLMAAAILLLYLADEDYRLDIHAFKITESVMGSIYVLIGLLSLVTAGYFLANTLNTGRIGDLISAGIIPIIYVVIGLKVGSELTGVLHRFIHGEVAE